MEKLLDAYIDKSIALFRLNDFGIVWTIVGLIIWFFLFLFLLFAPILLLFRLLPEDLILPFILIGLSALIFYNYKNRDSKKIPLDTQLLELKDLDIRLNRGITRKDLLSFGSLEEYEDSPYVLLISFMGSDVQRRKHRRRVSPFAWDFDYECVDEEDTYETIVKELVKLAQQEPSLTKIKSRVDFENQTISLNYMIGEFSRELAPNFMNDWADEKVIQIILSDIEDTANNGKHFWYVDNGQASTFLFISDQTAQTLNKLQKGLVSRCKASII